MQKYSHAFTFVNENVFKEINAHTHKQTNLICNTVKFCLCITATTFTPIYCLFCSFYLQFLERKLTQTFSDILYKRIHFYFLYTTDLSKNLNKWLTIYKSMNLFDRAETTHIGVLRTKREGEKHF